MPRNPIPAGPQVPHGGSRRPHPRRPRLEGCASAHDGHGLRRDAANVVPAPFLTPRLRAARQRDDAVLGDAAPLDFRRPAGRGRAGCEQWTCPRPFRPSGCRCACCRYPRARHCRIRWARWWRPSRSSTAERPGNYLVASSSFDYLQRAAQAPRQLDWATYRWQQARAMDEGARTLPGALRRRRPRHRFRGAGGPFAEGIDLPGRRPIGACIATAGRPSTPCACAICERLEARFGRGPRLHLRCCRACSAWCRPPPRDPHRHRHRQRCCSIQRYLEPRYRARAVARRVGEVGLLQARSSPRQAATKAAARSPTVDARRPAGRAPSRCRWPRRPRARARTGRADAATGNTGTSASNFAHRLCAAIVRRSPSAGEQLEPVRAPRPGGEGFAGVASRARWPAPRRSRAPRPRRCWRHHQPEAGRHGAHLHPARARSMRPGSAAPGAPMPRSGSGEFSGTSSSVRSASTRAWPTPSALVVADAAGWRPGAGARGRRRRRCGARVGAWVMPAALRWQPMRDRPRACVAAGWRAGRPAGLAGRN